MYKFLIPVFVILSAFFVCREVGAQGVQTEAKEAYSVDPLLKSALQANRRTALRCLSRAKKYASEKNWEAVISQTKLGSSYDPSISDLWYMMAVAKAESSEPKAEVKNCVEKAITSDSWIEYHRDAARILYADILCDTASSGSVFNLLDGRGEYESMPYITSADADFVRIKAYYRQKTPSSLKTARDLLIRDSRLYPTDMRFLTLFFTFENPDSMDQTMTRTVETFLRTIESSSSALEESDPSLEARAARFARGRQQVNILRSFNARGLKHPLYLVPALSCGLISQQEAFEYFKSFASDRVCYTDAVEFLSCITEDDVRSLVSSYMASYSGTISHDTNNDKIDDLFVSYSEGRPQTIRFDSNQDGICDWSIDCDYGLPYEGESSVSDISFSWGNYPFLSSVALNASNGTSKQTFNIISGELQWTPCLVEKDLLLTEASGTDFYFAYPIFQENLVITEEEDMATREEGNVLSIRRLLASSYNIVVPSEEKDGASITFLVQDGNIILAQYMQNGTMYAHAEFVDNVPLYRLVDIDEDGIYETTEFYALDSTGQMEPYSLEEERQVMINLYGIPSNGAKFYLRMVQVDTAEDGDAVPDFTEEYLAKGGRISSWDTDGDGKWDVRYVRYSEEVDSEGKTLPIREDAMFYDMDKNLVTVSLVAGKPTKVRSGAVELPVIEDSEYIFYWIGKDGGSENAEKVIKKLNQIDHKNVSVIIDVDKSYRIMGILAGDFCYGKIIEKEEAVKNEEAGKSSE